MTKLKISLILISYCYQQSLNFQHMLTNHILLLVFLSTLVCSFKITTNQNTKIQDDCDVPLITQYYHNYQMPLYDIEHLTINITGLSIDNTTNKNTAILSNIKAKFSYPKTNRTINYKSETQASVENDGFDIKLEYTAEVQKTGSKKQYSVVTYINYVPASYTKQFSLKDNRFDIPNAKYQIDPSKFNITFADSITDTDKNKIINATKTDLLKNLNTNLNGFRSWLNDNANNQHLSQTYISSPYQYSYNGFNAQINVESLKIQIDQQTNTLQNGLKGLLGLADEHCPSFMQQPQDNYHTFYSEQFIMNMAQYTVQNYASYQSVNISSSAKNKVFQFRVVDLQYVVNNLLTTYPNYYMKPIYFMCSLSSINRTDIESVNRRVNMDAIWDCKGYISTAEEGDIPILDFSIYLSHKLKVFILGSTFRVYADTIILKESQFRPVGSFVVSNHNLAERYMKSVFDSLSTYTVGTGFKVKEGSTNARLVDNTGIWVG